MKGFGVRERNGLIVFACVVLVLLGIGPLADSLGCTRHVRPDTGIVDTAAEADSAVAADSLREAGNRKNMRKPGKLDKTDKSNGKKKRKKDKNPAPEPQRRRMLDEQV